MKGPPVKRHELDLLSLAFGVVFVVLGVLGLMDRVVLSVSDVRWLVPVALIIMGIALVLPSGRWRGADDASPPEQGTHTVGEGHGLVPDEDAR
jgi:hypothetical protein